MDLGADAIFRLFNRILKYNLFYAGRWQGHKRCRLLHCPPPARGRPSHRSWARRLWMMPEPLPRHGRWRRGRRLHRPWLTRRRVLPCTLLRVLRPQLGGRATTSPTVVDVDPIRAVPDGARDVAEDQPQIDLAPGGPGVSGAQVPPSSTSSLRLPRRSMRTMRTIRTMSLRYPLAG
jgi:hypothetical protein